MRGIYRIELPYRPLTHKHRSCCSSLYFRHSFIKYGFNPVPHWRCWRCLQTPTLSVLITQSVTPLSVLLQATLSDAVMMGTTTVKYPIVTMISALISSLVGGGLKYVVVISHFWHFVSVIELLVYTKSGIQTYHNMDTDIDPIHG